MCRQLGGGSSIGPGGSRDIHFVHTYIVYQLLSRRIQRDLLIASVLLASQNNLKDAFKHKTEVEQVDNRLYPAVVKLLETVFKVWIICALLVLLMKVQIWLRLLKQDRLLREPAGT